MLLPLSAARAEAVKRTMVDRGLESAMFTTVGVGATDQLVPVPPVVGKVAVAGE